MIASTSVCYPYGLVCVCYLDRQMCVCVFYLDGQASRSCLVMTDCWKQTSTNVSIMTWAWGTSRLISASSSYTRWNPYTHTHTRHYSHTKITHSPRTVAILTRFIWSRVMSPDFQKDWRSFIIDSIAASPFDSRTITTAYTHTHCVFGGPCEDGSAVSSVCTS